MTSIKMINKPTDRDLDTAWDTAYDRLSVKYPDQPIPSDEHTLLQFQIATGELHLDPKLTYFALGLDTYYFLYVVRGDELILNPAIDPVFYAVIKHYADAAALEVAQRGRATYPQFATIEDIPQQLFAAGLNHVVLVLHRSPDRGILFETTMKAAFMEAWNDRMRFIEEKGLTPYMSVSPI